MKILLISNDYWNLYNFRKDLIENIINSGHKVSLLANEDEYFNKFKNLNLKSYKIRLESRKISLINEIILFKNLYKKIKFIEPDLILTFTIKPNIYASIISRSLKIKAINNITGLGSSFLNNFLLKKITILLYRNSIYYSHKVFFQNTYDRDLFTKLNIVKKSNSDIVPGSGVDTDYFKSVKNIPSEKNIFLFVGRLLKDKGIYEYLKAAKIIMKNNNQCEFYIIGKIDSADNTSIKIEELNKYLNDNIKYFSFTKDPRKFYENASCVILPSYREGLSKSLLEATSMSRPIITTDVPGCKDVVKDSINGFLVKKSDVESLVNGINKFTNTNYEEKKMMGNNSRKIAENNFKTELVISKYLKIIKEI